MFRTSLTAALMTLLTLVCSGATCQRVQLADNELCGDKGELGARCRTWFTGKVRVLTFDEWAEERFGQICMNEDAFANIKAAILKLCGNGRCTKQEVQDVKAVGFWIEGFNSEVKSLKALK